MSKYNLEKVVSDLQKLYHKKNPSLAEKIGLGSKLRTLDANNFLKMPQWWVTATNTIGLPFGKLVMIAGDSDSGKTSCAIAAMKAAQEQDIAILYVETEGKTTAEDLLNWGVDPNGIMLVQEAIAERAFDALFAAWDTFFSVYPDGRLLVVFDSLGNVVSRHDAELDMADSNSKPGGKGKTNRAGINRLVAKLEENDAAVLIINYTYDNIGSPGKTNAGGKAVNFFSSLTYQTSRKGWVEATVKGEKVRKGAIVQWKLFKNHIDKANPGPKVVDLKITAEGISVAGMENE